MATAAIEGADARNGRGAAAMVVATLAAATRGAASVKVDFS